MNWTLKRVCVAFLLIWCGLVCQRATPPPVAAVTHVELRHQPLPGPMDPTDEDVVHLPLFSPTTCLYLVEVADGYTQAQGRGGGGMGGWSPEGWAAG